MRARRLLYSVMVCLPAIVLGSIALEARLRPITYEWPEGSTVQAERLAAYGPIVRHTRNILSDRGSSLEQCEELADLWIARLQSGSIRPIYSTAIEDGIRFGLKGEVFSAKRQLSIRLRVSASKLTESDPGRSARNLVRAIQVSEVAKYCDFEAVAITAEEQEQLIASLRDLWPSIPARDRARAADQLADICSSQPNLVPLMAIAYGGHVQSGSPNDGTSSLSAIIHRAGPGQDTCAEIDEAMRQCRNMPAIKFLGLIRRGFESQLQFMAAVEGLAKASAQRYALLR